MVGSPHMAVPCVGCPHHRYLRSALAERILTPQRSEGTYLRHPDARNVCRLIIHSDCRLRGVVAGLKLLKGFEQLPVTTTSLKAKEIIIIPQTNASPGPVFGVKTNRDICKPADRLNGFLRLA